MEPTDRLVMLGIDHTRAGLEVRDRLAFAGDDLGRGLAALRAAADEALVLSTCNRTEVYALLPAPEGGDGTLRRVVAGARGVDEATVAGASVARSGPGAARHLLRVAAGLESMVLGEPQILGQLRAALDAARAARALGPVLGRLGTDALRAGKRARAVTGIARNRTSTAHAGLDLAARELGGLRGRAALVVGAGEIGTLLAKLLRGAGVGDLVVANRTLARAEALAAAVGGRAVPMAALPAELGRADVAFAAALAACGHVVRAEHLAPGFDGRSRPLVVVDLGVPRNVDPDLAGHPLIRLRDVDDLGAVAAEARDRYAAEIVRVEALVGQAVAEFLAWWAGREAAPTIAALGARAEAVRAAETEAALRRLGHLCERDREVVRALAAGLTGKLLHPAVTHLRAAPPADLAAARRLFGLTSEG